MKYPIIALLACIALGIVAVGCASKAELEERKKANEAPAIIIPEKPKPVEKSPPPKEKKIKHPVETAPKAAAVEPKCGCEKVVAAPKPVASKQPGCQCGCEQTDLCICGSCCECAKPRVWFVERRPCPRRGFRLFRPWRR